MTASRALRPMPYSPTCYYIRAPAVSVTNNQIISGTVPYVLRTRSEGGTGFQGVTTDVAVHYPLNSQWYGFVSMGARLTPASCLPVGLPSCVVLPHQILPVGRWCHSAQQKRYQDQQGRYLYFPAFPYLHLRNDSPFEYIIRGSPFQLTSTYPSLVQLSERSVQLPLEDGQTSSPRPSGAISALHQLARDSKV